jgi:hypothetical protein
VPFGTPFDRSRLTRSSGARRSLGWAWARANSSVVQNSSKGAVPPLRSKSLITCSNPAVKTYQVRVKRTCAGTADGWVPLARGFFALAVGALGATGAPSAWSCWACRCAFQVFRARERFVGAIASQALYRRRASRCETSGAPSSG